MADEKPTGDAKTPRRIEV